MNRIFVEYSTNLTTSTYSLMEQANVYRRLSPEMKVVILPDLSTAKPSWQGSTTHKEIVEGVIQYLQMANITNISIVQSAWTKYSAQQAFAVTGYLFLEDKYNVKLVDVDNDGLVSFFRDDINYSISETVYESDFIINVPVLKRHSQLDISCCFNNILNCVPSSDKRLFYIKGIKKSINTLSKNIRSDLHIVDNVCSDYIHELGETPLYQDRIYLGQDPLILTSYGAELMGFDSRAVEGVRHAYSLNLGEIYNSAIHPIIEVDSESRPKHTRPLTRQTQELSQYINSKQACTACYSAIIIGLHRALEEHIITNKDLSKFKFRIGKKYQGKIETGIGVGNCCKLFDNCISGCPTSAIDVLRFIKEYSIEKI